MLCHRLVVEDDRLADYRLRLGDQKAKAVEAFRSLNYHVVAVGDSYNDMTMLAAADRPGCCSGPRTTCGPSIPDTPAAPPTTTSCTC